MCAVWCGVNPLKKSKSASHVKGNNIVLTEYNIKEKKKKNHLCTLDKHCGVVCFLLNSSSELLILFVLQRSCFHIEKDPVEAFVLGGAVEGIL